MAVITGAPRARTQWKMGSAQAFTSYPAQLAQSSRLIRAWQWSWSKGVGEGPCQLYQHRLWLLPQRRKWAACGHWATVLTGWGGGVPLFFRVPQRACLVEVEGRNAERVLLVGGLCTFQGLGPRGEARLSERFPEAHFLWAAQDVVS